jgi:hypothetical protein
MNTTNTIISRWDKTNNVGDFMNMKSWTQNIFLKDLRIPFFLALLQFIVVMIFNGNYDYFRDELYYIACSDHLAFGYVDQPPLSIVILRINRLLLGDSIYALRFLPALVGSGVVIIAALMARQLGGTKFAQGFAALSVVAAHGLIGHCKLFSMNPFDVLFWTLAGYSVIIIFSDEKPKIWLYFGLIVGLGLLNKYSVGFMVIGLVSGLVLTKQRKHLLSKWFWFGAVIATIVFLPHVIWEITNGLPSLEFMRNASQNKNIGLGVVGFFIAQVKDLNIFNAPIWLGGIYFFFKHDKGRYRPLGWMFIIVYAIMILSNAKVYYLSAIFPVFLAGGAVLFEQFVTRKSFNWLKPVYITCLSLVAIIILPFALPVLPVEDFIKYQKSLGLAPRQEERSSVAELPQYYADQFGWREMVDSVASVYNKLTPEEQSQCFIFVRNYGEAAAIDFYGIKYGLPKAACAHNSYWHWGPGERTGDIAIIFGNNRLLEDNFADFRRRWTYVEFAATTNAKYAMPFENNRMIFLCKHMNTTFQNLWPWERFYI